MPLLAGVFAIFGLFHWSASFLGSDRGQMGLVVGALVVAATMAAERIFFSRSTREASRALGLRRPRMAGMAAAVGASAVLLATILLFQQVTNTSMVLSPDWIGLAPGLFAQAGIAEEILFRGYLFGHVSASRPFWKAAALSTIPFAVVHLFLFAVMAWPLALAAVLLSLVTSIPFARLFVLGGRTIWPSALLHTIIQAVVKVVVVSPDQTLPFALTWMLASALVPLAILFVRLPLSAQPE
jgi:membrane protease YdiL (CAAX protease family)